MARLAVGVAFVDGEANVVVRERAIPRERARRRPRVGWRQERIAALGAEEVLFVVRPLSQLVVVERDEPLVDNRRLAVITLRGELLRKTKHQRQL